MQDSQFEFVFDHLYQYDDDPLVIFTKTADMFILQILIFIKLNEAVPFYYTRTLPVPDDTYQCLHISHEYTLLQVLYKYCWDVSVRSTAYAIAA